jgi:hypothetical protein
LARRPAQDARAPELKRTLVDVEGWLRSTPVAVVVVDRVIYLTVTDAMRELVGRHKAGARSGKPPGNPADQRAG